MNRALKARSVPRPDVCTFPCLGCGRRKVKVDFCSKCWARLFTSTRIILLHTRKHAGTEKHESYANAIVSALRELGEKNRKKADKAVAQHG